MTILISFLAFISSLFKNNTFLIKESVNGDEFMTPRGGCYRG